MREGNSGIGEMRKLLSTGFHTKEQLAYLTGLKMSTVNVQLGSHLKKKFSVLKKIEDNVLKYSIAPKEELEDPSDNGLPTKAEIHTQTQREEALLADLEEDDVKHATDEELKELAEASDDMSGVVAPKCEEGHGDDGFEPVPGMSGAYRMKRT
jgi:hypothetical protein